VLRVEPKGAKDPLERGGMAFVSHTDMADYERARGRIVHHDTIMTTFLRAIVWFLDKPSMTASATPGIRHADGSLTRLL